ncbi:hypothetical protein ONZ45_g16519 [Pleurotus djamor]|nr:hypothetical protein ONZ45_g16519 [Pleurotus djamor]
MPPMLIPGTEPDHFTLNVSGIAGFLGGEEAISAMESVHFYKYRKYLGLYNTPGSYMVAKHYGKLANSQLWDGLYPGVNDEPAKFLKMDGEPGPKFIGTVSGTTIDDIGHIGYIFAQMCRRDLDPTIVVDTREDKTGTPTPVTIVQLVAAVKQGGGGGNEEKNGRQGGEQGNEQDEEGHGKKTQIKPKNITIECPTTFPSTPLRHIIAIATIVFNMGACLVCGIFQEWYAFALILLGILCNGFACFEIGSAKIFLGRPRPSTLSPSGHGVINDRDQLIVLRGKQADVNYITVGKFIVKYGSEDDGKYHRLGLSATALTFQFIAQLFLIPQSGLFGQILFLSTLAVSWINNACFSSIDKEALQKRILKKTFPFEQLKPFGTKYIFPTRTAGVVFAMLQALPLEELKEKDKSERAAHIRNILESLLPKGPDHWKEWMDIVTTKVSKMIDDPLSEWSASPFADQEGGNKSDQEGRKSTDLSLPPEDQHQRLKLTKLRLLNVLLEDAGSGVSEFCQVMLNGQGQVGLDLHSEGQSPEQSEGYSKGGSTSIRGRTENIPLDVMSNRNDAGA